MIILFEYMHETVLSALNHATEIYDMFDLSALSEQPLTFYNLKFCIPQFSHIFRSPGNNKFPGKYNPAPHPHPPPPP